MKTTTFEYHSFGRLLEEKICGTCGFHKRDLFDDEEWRCDCEHSEHYCLETAYEDTCSSWEERE